MLFFFFMAFNLLEATLPSLVSKESPAASRGTAMGVYSTSQFMGAFLGGTLAGLLLESYGLSGVVALMVGVLICWLCVAVTMPSPSHATSFVLELRAVSPEQFAGIDETLRKLPGVQDVVILEEAQTAYLKIDRQYFNEELLAGYEFIQPRAPA